MTSHNHHHELPHKRTPLKLKREYAVWLLVAVALLLGLGVVIAADSAKSKNADSHDAEIQARITAAENKIAELQAQLTAMSDYAKATEAAEWKYQRETESRILALSVTVTELQSRPVAPLKLFPDWKITIPLSFQVVKPGPAPAPEVIVKPTITVTPKITVTPPAVYVYQRRRWWPAP